jgi:hypothetical protein
MAMPSGDSPTTAENYYLYLQGHHQTDGRVVTWDVDWFSIAWMWGWLVVMIVVLVWWILQYRRTLQRGGLYPVDRWGPYVTEVARPASRFFVVFAGFLTAFAIMIILGHLIWGQKF